MRSNMKNRPWEPKRQPSRPSQLLDLARLEPSAPVIPALALRPKEKDDERKGAGAPWLTTAGEAEAPAAAISAGEAGSSAFSLFMGRSPVVSASLRPGFLGSRLIAASLVKFFGGPGTSLGGLFASNLGPALVVAGMAAWAVFLGAAAFKLFAGVETGSGAQVSRLWIPRASDRPSTSLVVHGPNDRSLSYLAYANRGELHPNENGMPISDAPTPEKEAAQAPAPQAQEAPKVEVPDLLSLAEGKAKGLKTMSFPGGAAGQWNASGDTLRDSVAGLKSNQATAAMLGRLGAPGATKGTPTAPRTKTAAMLGRTVLGAGSAGRAVGQLKFANRMSRNGASAATENAAKQFSTSAFEQAQPIGGIGLGASGDGIVVPPGNGAPGVSDASSPLDSEDVPAFDPGDNATPYQPQMDKAKDAGDQSAMLKIIGGLLLALGGMLLAIGLKLLKTPDITPITKIIAKIVIGIGVALIAAGIAVLAMSMAQGNKAKDLGNQIQDQYGQQDQGDIVEECADQAENSGVKSDQCKPETRPEVQRGTVHQDVKIEQGVMVPAR